MSTTLFAPRPRKLMHSLLLLSAVGAGLWAFIGTYHYSSAALVTASVECSDATDVLMAMDRSRNGVSLTCNTGTLNQAARP